MITAMLSGRWLWSLLLLWLWLWLWCSGGWLCHRERMWADPGERNISFQQFIFSVNQYHFNWIGQVSWIMLQRLWDFQLRLSLLRPFLHSTLDFFCTIAKTEEYFFLKEKNESSVIYPVVQLAYQWRHIWQGAITPIINIFIIVINDMWLFFPI